MIKHKFLLFLVGAVGVFFLLHVIERTCITIRLPDKQNSFFFLAPADPGDQFSLTYRHSVEKTLVKGVFQVSKVSSILAVETRMTSVGTGLPNTDPNRTLRDGKWIVVDEEKKEIDNFRFFISRVNKTILTTPNHTIDLMALPSGTIILVGVEKVDLFSHGVYWISDFFKKTLSSRTTK